ncbi:MAG: arginase family protein [FCB group bacterium]|nr:arginase family protein [FCB group bacterium]
MKIEIIGAPFNGLGTHPDIENPADGLRQAGLVSLLSANGHVVDDLGDINGFQGHDIRDPETGINDFDLWLGLSQKLSQTVGAILDRNSFPLVLGGDCRMLVGIFSALVQKKTNTGLVFLDGHADFHTADTSPTGDPADMELAILTGRGPDQITHLAGKYPMLNDRDVVVYGIRAWDHIAESDIEVYDQQRITKIGIDSAVKEGLRGFTQRELPVWLHFDVDVLDPDVMPVMFPEPGGFNFEEIQSFLKLVWNSSKIEGLSIACYHPRLDTDGSAGKRLVTLISEVLSPLANN